MVVVDVPSWHWICIHHDNGQDTEPRLPRLWSAGAVAYPQPDTSRGL